MITKFCRRFAAVALAVLVLSSAATADNAPYSRIVAFGDSLMDSGNAFALTGDIATPPFAPIPSAAYAVGGHHFSNGRTWVEQLGQALGLQGSTGPSVRQPGVFFNYAVGGARARDGAAGVSASQQVAQFLGDSGGVAAGDALYVFGFGGNDVRDALANQNPTLVAEAVQAIAGNLLSLCASGAQHILVANVANVGTTPFARQFGPPVTTAATQLSAGLNQGVQFAIANFVRAFCPTTTFYTLDLFGLSTAVQNFPQGFGFVDADPCLSFNVTGEAICSRPGMHFFWDGIHPTEAGHALVAGEAVRLVTTP